MASRVSDPTIAAFERTLITKDRFDDFQRGDDEALSDLELKGLETFTGIGCTTCHTGPLLGGGMYQKVGLVHPYENFSDLGREAVTRTKTTNTNSRCQPFAMWPSPGPTSMMEG